MSLISMNDTVSVCCVMMEAHNVRRTWGVSEQKIVAARQGWKCALCPVMLPASFELDHETALWAGGLDCYETNAQALCNACHAAKSQRENIARQKQLREARIAAIEKARRDSPLEEIQEPERPRKKRAAPITSPDYVDPLLDNPFLKYAFIPLAQPSTPGPGMQPSG
jgi:hypothetical protein